MCSVKLRFGRTSYKELSLRLGTIGKNIFDLVKLRIECRSPVLEKFALTVLPTGLCMVSSNYVEDYPTCGLMHKASTIKTIDSGSFWSEQTKD